MLISFSLKYSSLPVVLLSVSLSGFSQKKELTEDQLLKNNLPAIVTPLPSVISWDKDDELVLGRKAHPDSAAVNFIFNLKTTKETIINKQQDKQDTVNTKTVYLKNDDLFLKDGRRSEIQLTNDRDKEVNAQFSPDSNYVAYTKANNLFIFDLRANKEIQLTTDGNDSLMNGYASWVYTEEILGRASEYRAFWWSPDSRHLAFFRTDDSPVPVYTITDGSGPHGLVEKERYPKAGDSNPEVRIGIADAHTHTIAWADFNQKDDQYFGMPYWKPDGSALLAQWLNRAQDNLKIYEVDPGTGVKREFYDEKQKTWIDLDDLNRIEFLKNGKGFILLSDKTGWRHMYYYDINGRFINAVTSGKFTVTNIERIDDKSGIVYFTARSLENSARTDFYSVRLNGRDLKRLTFGEYNHTIRMSPSGDYFITTYSNVSTPERMTIVDKKGKVIKELANSRGPEFADYDFAKTELIRVKSDDGLFDLPSVITWPLHMDPNKHYPVLISIYGGPDAGTVTDKWLLNSNQQWYAREGLIQIAMDHRASGQFGKVGVNYMYHNLGYWEMKDYGAIVRYLIDKGYADPKKICITGFSYGGYMTCYALTYGADIFTHGMAGGSVTDWAFYDTHYTEKYMGTPANNPEGYKKSSVLTYTDKYKGMLQIAHGVIDDNVHLQNSLRLISALEDQKKPFEFMLYPGGRHGWRGNKWLHYLNLRTAFIYKYLLERPVPAGFLK